jgi:hypothetical protein
LFLSKVIVLSSDLTRFISSSRAQYLNSMLIYKIPVSIKCYVLNTSFKLFGFQK